MLYIKLCFFLLFDDCDSERERQDAPQNCWAQLLGVEGRMKAIFEGSGKSANAFGLDQAIQSVEVPPLCASAAAVRSDWRGMCWWDKMGGPVGEKLDVQWRGGMQ